MKCIVFYMHISIRNISIELRAKFYIQLEHVKCLHTYVDNYKIVEFKFITNFIEVGVFVD